jgi:hypothetical protein
MIDPLKSIGIEKGKTFSPDVKTQDTLNDAMREAHAWLVDRYENATSQPPIMKADTGQCPRRPKS